MEPIGHLLPFFAGNTCVVRLFVQYFAMKVQLPPKQLHQGLPERVHVRAIAVVPSVPDTTHLVEVGQQLIAFVGKRSKQRQLGTVWASAHHQPQIGGRKLQLSHQEA